MNQLYLQKNLPAPLQSLIRPMLLISLGLHGLVMAMPIPDAKKAEIPKKEEKVKISQLPSPVSSPTPKATPSPNLLTQPTPVASPLIPRSGAPVIRQPPIQSPVRQAIQQPQQNQTPAPTAQQKPSPQVSQSPSPQSSPQQTTNNPFADFPIYSGAQHGSGAVLKSDYDTAGYVYYVAGEMGQVAPNFEQQVKAKGFTLSPLPGDSVFKVYQVSKGNTPPQFLHLISQDGKTVMLLAPSQYTLEALKNDSIQNPVETTLETIFQQVDQEISTAAIDPNNHKDIPDLAEAAKFVDRDGNPDVNKFNFRAKTTPKSIALQDLASKLEAQMRSNGLEPVKVGNYGGGSVYKVSKSGTTSILYLILAPADSNKRTYIITSKQAP